MIAINKGGDSFTNRWVKYCTKSKIPFILVDCFSVQFINDIKRNNIKAFMWHHSHMKGKDILVSKYIFNTLQHYGINVFPNYYENWHFDDKVAQAYLSNIFDLPFVKTFIFYEKKEALNFIKNYKSPIVAKLRGGSGSSNVRLLKEYNATRRYISKAFGKGLRNYSPLDNLKERYRKYRNGIAPFKSVLAGVYRFFIPTDYSVIKGREKGYVYFQEFIPNNLFDIRVIVVDGKAFAIKRMVRKNDFRASGGGNIIYDYQQIPVECLEISFKICRCLKFNCMTFDYVFDELKKPKVVEFSYGFRASGYDKCMGYWDTDLNWYEGEFNPYGWMVEHVLNKVK